MLPPIPKDISSVSIPEYFSPSSLFSITKCPFSVFSEQVEGEKLPAHDFALWGSAIHRIAEIFESEQWGERTTPNEAMNHIFQKVLEEQYIATGRKDYDKRLPFFRKRNRLLFLRKKVQQKMEHINGIKAEPLEYWKQHTARTTKKHTQEHLFIVGMEKHCHSNALRISGQVDNSFVEETTLIIDDTKTHIIDFPNYAQQKWNMEKLKGYYYQLIAYKMVAKKTQQYGRIELRINNHPVEQESTFLEYKDQIENDIRMLASQFPSGKSIDNSVAQIGSHCRNCQIRHRCATYKKNIPDQWSNPTFAVPNDVWGTVVDILPHGQNHKRIRIYNAEQNIFFVVYGIPKEKNISKDMKLYIFNLGVPPHYKGSEVSFTLYDQHYSSCTKKRTEQASYFQER